MSSTHSYDLDKNPATGTTIVSCSECGDMGVYPSGEAVTAFVQVHDQEHRLAGVTTPTQEDIDTWLAGPEPRAWEPPASERAGLVTVPLGHVALVEAMARVADHECPALRRAKGYERTTEAMTLRILDVNGRASDHAVDPEAAIDLSCITEELGKDDRVDTAWFVRQREGRPEHA